MSSSRPVKCTKTQSLSHVGMIWTITVILHYPIQCKFPTASYNTQVRFKDGLTMRNNKHGTNLKYNTIKTCI